jgi:tRNA modification GTPase
VFAPDDTIAAIATPPGRGGIGVVRISGPWALDVARALLTAEAFEPRRATFTRLAPLKPGPAAGGVHSQVDSVDARGVHQVELSDEVVATFFPSPHSYTGQDVVEISAHGSPVVLHAIVQRAMDAGARLAEPGEFTLRAFLNGKRDLVRAEAVADLIDAVTPLQARMAFDQLEGTLTARIGELDAALFDLIAKLEASLDFPDEGYHFVEPAEIGAHIGRIMRTLDALLQDADRGRVIREGAQVVIAGRPNVGKSSLFNALVGAERAIVTPIPGTTRDLITERVDINGLAVTLVDTAGTHDTLDIVEREGVLRGDRARAVADLVLVVLDASEPLTVDDQELLARTTSSQRLVVANKVDAATRSQEEERSSAAGEGSHESRGGTGREQTRSASADLYVSATTGAGLETLRAAITHALTGDESLRDTPAISNARHATLLRAARLHLDAARSAALSASSEEFVLTDLQAARQRFDEVVGRRTTDDLLAHIFERFCIGK